MSRTWADQAKRAVIAVGKGRGFVVRQDMVITAAHCLPKLPPANWFSIGHDKAYRRFLGPLTKKRRTIMTECAFADPVSDIAVLGQPDNQVFYAESDAYDAFIEDVGEPLAISDAKTGPAWVLSLEGEWVAVDAEVFGRVLFYTDGPCIGGMSGSPILANDGSAIALISTGTEATDQSGGKRRWDHGPHPLISQCLPRWLLQSLQG